MREREKTVSERIEECKRMRHWGDVEKNNNLPIEAILGESFEEFDEYEGFVLDGNLPKDLRRNLNSNVFPFKKGKYNRVKTEEEEAKAIEMLGIEDVILLAIKGENRDWSVGFVAEDDIRNPDLEEMTTLMNRMYSIGYQDFAYSKNIAIKAVKG